MASDINTGTAPCSNTAAAIDCLSPLVAIRLCGSLETAQPMLNTTLAIHLTSKKVDAFAFVTHRLIQGYRFRVGPYRFCGASNPTTHSILLWSYLILSDAHIIPSNSRHRNGSYQGTQTIGKKIWSCRNCTPANTKNMRMEKNTTI